MCIETKICTILINKMKCAHLFSIHAQVKTRTTFKIDPFCAFLQDVHFFLAKRFFFFIFLDFCLCSIWSPYCFAIDATVCSYRNCTCKNTSMTIIKMLSATASQQIHTSKMQWSKCEIFLRMVYRVCMWQIVKVQQKWRGSMATCLKHTWLRMCVIEQMQPDQIIAITCNHTMPMLMPNSHSLESFESISVSLPLRNNGNQTIF